MAWRKLLVLCAAAGLVGAAPSAAETVVLGASKDNTLYQSSGDLSNGAGEHFFAGRSLQGAGLDIKRAVIAFDVASQVPAGSTVTAATLTLRMSRSNQAGATPVSLHRVLVEWGEAGSDPGDAGQGAPAQPGDATWTHRFYATDLWSAAGGQFAPVASATTMVGASNGFYAWTSAQLAADVQAWINDPGGNCGWILIGDESVAPSAKRYDSRQNGNASRRPRLTIEFIPPAQSGACCFAQDGACTTLTGAGCAAAGGSYQGDQTACEPSPCPQPQGACCLVEMPCQVLAAAACLDAGGTFQGAGSACDPDPCPQGACCLAGAPCAVTSAGGCAAAGGAYQGDGSACEAGTCPLVLAPFVDPLPIPGVIEPVSGEPGGVAEYEIPVVQFQHQYHRDLPPTTVWGYAGVTPGPRIEASVGMPVTVTWINDLRDESGALRSDHVLPVDPCLHGPDMAGPAPRIVTHLHGGHVPAESDGYPEHTILPGETVTYEYPNLQPPAQLWFHDHALGITRLNVYMGMAGLYTLRDEAEAALDLPSGAYEIPLVIQDRSFNADGSLSYPALWQEHVFGDVLVVNGKVWPYLEVGRGKYRFRLLNGSNSRTYALALSDGATFHQIGTDGGLLGAPVAVGGVTLAPGERADVVIDFAGYAPGTELILTNTAPAPFPGEPGVGVIPDVLKLLVTSAGGHTAPLPGVLRPLEPLLEETALRSRALELRKFAEACAGSWWLIDGLGWDEVTERPRLDTTEVWSFVNRSGVMHPMHMHLVLFQVLDRQAFEVVDGVVVPVGEPILPSPAEAGWKDTVQAPPGEITRVIARFERFAGLFPYHCHILEHEDHEMMRQFQTLPACPGDTGGDGVTDVQDLVAVVLAWGTADPFADVTADGVVDVQDLVAVLLGWGPCPQ